MVRRRSSDTQMVQPPPAAEPTDQEQIDALREELAECDRAERSVRARRESIMNRMGEIRGKQMAEAHERARRPKSAEEIEQSKRLSRLGVAVRQAQSRHRSALRDFHMTENKYNTLMQRNDKAGAGGFAAQLEEDRERVRQAELDIAKAQAELDAAT